MSYGDPSSSASRFAPPRRGRWKCPECGARNDDDNTNWRGEKECFSCDAEETRP